jgi:hypothetical protein
MAFFLRSLGLVGVLLSMVAFFDSSAIGATHDLDCEINDVNGKSQHMVFFVNAENLTFSHPNCLWQTTESQYTSSCSIPCPENPKDVCTNVQEINKASLNYTNYFTETQPGGQTDSTHMSDGACRQLY